MANISYSLTGTANPDAANIASMSGQPSSRNAYTYTFHGLAGADTFYVAGSNAQNGQYSGNFSAAKFSIGTTTLNNALPGGTVPNGTGANAGMYVVSGASNGGTSFTFVLDSVETLVFSDKVVTLSYADTTPPTLSTSSPLDAATGVALNSNIFITFSEAVSLGTGPIEIHNGSGTLVASTANATIIASISGNTLTIDPTVNLSALTSYYVSLTANSIKDLAGNFLTSVINPHFTTGSTTDTTIPTLSLTTAPVPIAVNSNIDISFSEAIALGTGAIEIHNGSATGALVASSATATIAASVSGNMLHLDPVNDLAYNTHYVVTFNGSSVNDLAGNHLANSAVYDFSTPLADPYAGVTHNMGVDAGPVVVGVGGLGVLAWALLL